jgi:KDO2-lipid IV(A) lauroyltransferase
MTRTWLARAAFALLAQLPLAAAHALGNSLGLLARFVPNRRRRTAETNLRLCFPELDARSRARLLTRSLREYLKGACELGVLWTRDAARIRRLVRAVEGEGLLREALARGRGVLIAAPHLGAWELVGLYCSLLKPMTSLYRNPPMSGLGTLMRQARERLGARLVPADAGGVRSLYKALERGEMVGILPDQVPGGAAGAAFAPFFGIDASTMLLLPRLAHKTGATVLCVYAERLPWARGYRLHVRAAPAAVASASPQVAAAAVNAMVEDCVRALPAQYQWVYKRFRVRPPGAPAFY